MKVASITVTMNDWHSISKWVEYFKQYQEDIYMHIIVDNGSSKDYIQHLKQLFTNSVIIERTENGGTTAAYNDGIKVALSDPEVDSILLIANDIMVQDNLVKTLHSKLFNNVGIGMIAPIMLSKDSNIIESYGLIMKTKVSLKNNFHGIALSENIPDEIYVDMVPGGMHLSKKLLYEKIGLQDDSLFMYSDEVDLAIRIKKSGYKVLIIKDTCCWHQHINTSGKKGRGELASFLQARNKLLLAYKHYNFFTALETFFIVNCTRLPYVIRRSFLNKNFNLFYYYLLGTIYGIFNIKKIKGLK